MMLNAGRYGHICCYLLRRLVNIAVVTLHRRNIIQETRRLGESLPLTKR